MSNEATTVFYLTQTMKKKKKKPLCENTHCWMDKYSVMTLSEKYLNECETNSLLKCKNKTFH